jgi:RNA polymerase sigma-70 factor (ECF subfamily)
LAEERRKLVRAALARLPGRDAEILMLKYTENWSYHQIASHLGIGHSAVEARLHRARARMRAELAALNVVEIGGG